MEQLGKIFGIVGAAGGAVVGFIKLVKYLASARKRTDTKLDDIKRTLSEQHEKDFIEVKQSLGDFKSAIDVMAQKLTDSTDRVNRLDQQLGKVNENILTFKGAIDSTTSTVKNNSERIDDIEDSIEEHDNRILTMEVRSSKAGKAKAKSAQSNRKRKIKKK